MATFVRLLGPPSVRVGDQVYEPAPSRVSALAYYLAARDGWVDRGEACALLWPERSEAKARANLRQVLHGLRDQPWAVALEIERGRLRWPVATDLSGDGGRSAAERNGASVLLDGFRLPDAPGFEAWLDAERAAVAQRLRDRRLDDARAALEAGRPADALPPLDAALRQDPLDEPVLRLALEACRADGRGQEAWSRYTAFARRLAAELDLEPAPATTTLAEGLGEHARRDRGAAAGRAAAEERTRVNGRRSRPFVGREEEIERLVTWLSDAPSLAVVTGPGGIGKTRLAAEVASIAAERTEAAFFPVVLEEARDVASAAAQVATAVEAPDLGDVVPRDRIVAALRHRRAVVLLDNVEQIDDIETLLSDLRDACGTVAWIATSRRRLAVPAARTLTLRGLPVAPRASGEPASSPAAALLVSRLQDAGGHVEPDDADAIDEICRATGGMPLALELAAGWARVLSPRGVVERWRRGAALDAGGDELLGDDLPERHRALRRVFDTSWELLDSADRAALLRLTVFHGGCSVDAANEVADVGLGRLASLRDASMLDLDRDGRVRMHPLIDRYLRAKAVERDAVADGVRARHAAWSLNFLREQEDRGQREDPRGAVAALQREHANLEVAWAYGLEHGPYEPFAAGGAFLAFSYGLGGRMDGWMALVEEALRRIPRDHLSWAVLEAHHASFDAFLELHERGYRRCRAAAEIARRHDDPWGVGWAVFHHALTALEYGAYEEGRAGALEAAELWTRAGEPDHASMCFQALHTRELDLAERDRLYEQGEAVRAAGVQDAQRSDAYLPRALDLAESHGRFGEALALADRSVAIERRMAWNAIDLGLALTVAARVRLLTGDLPGAREAVEEAIDVASFLGKRSYFDVRDALARGAEARRLAGDPDGAQATLEMRLPGIETRHAAMHVVRGAIALDTDRGREARQAADAARAWLEARAPSRATLATGAELRLLELEIALRDGDERAARRSAREALRHAERHRFLPFLSHALALARPLLPDDDAEAVLRTVRVSPATPYAARRLVAGDRGDDAPRDREPDETAIRALGRAAYEALELG
jgi:DNA-binding SARP family transcriptional activator/predicted ATPase